VTIKPPKRPPANRGQGRKSVQGAGKSPVLQVVVSQEIKTAAQGYGMSWVREVLEKAIAKKAKEVKNGTV
jgi:hypothetical protein